MTFARTSRAARSIVALMGSLRRSAAWLAVVCLFLVGVLLGGCSAIAGLGQFTKENCGASGCDGGPEANLGDGPAPDHRRGDGGGGTDGMSDGGDGSGGVDALTPYSIGGT